MSILHYIHKAGLAYKNHLFKFILALILYIHCVV